MRKLTPKEIKCPAQITDKPVSAGPPGPLDTLWNFKLVSINLLFAFYHHDFVNYPLRKIPAKITEFSNLITDLSENLLRL